MQKYFNTVTNRSGTAQSSAFVTVKTLAGTTPTLYSDNGSTPMASNVIPTDDNGYFEFYAADGRYTLTITGSNFNTITISDILLEDAADGSTPLTEETNARIAADAAAAAALAASTGAALVGFAPSGTIAAGTVQAALEELGSEKAAASDLSAATGAAMVGNAPAGGIAATTVQAAIDELDSEKASLTALAASGGAALVGYLPAGTGAVVTDVQSKLRGLDSTEIYLNPFGLMAACEAFRKLETLTGGPFYVGISGYGDSMASPGGYMLSVLHRALQMRYGMGGLFTPNLGQSWLSASWTFAGGAAAPFTDWTYLPGANQITMPTGSTAQITTGNFTPSSSAVTAGSFPQEFSQQDQASYVLFFRKVRCFYIKRPGDGTLTFTVSQTNVTGYSPEVVSCDAATGLGYVDITVIDPAIPVTLHAAASVAGCLFVGAVFLRESGVLAWSSQVGGSTMEQQNAYITAGNHTAIYAPLCAALSTGLFIHAQRVPGDANWQANYITHFNALDTIPGTSQLVLGEPPRTDVASPIVPVINDYLRTQCLSRGYAFYDQYKALGNSNAVLTTLGWGDADGVHLDPPAHRYLAARILAEVDWFRMGGNKLDAAPLTMAQLLKVLTRLQAQVELRTSSIAGRSGSTMEGNVTSGGFTFAAENSKGFLLNSAAALGYAAGRPGNVITNSPAVSTGSCSVYTSFVGYRNTSLPAGVRAFALVGVTSTFSNLSALNQRCYGFECAKGSDVGSPSGLTGEVVRLLHSDGTTTTYGQWVSANTPGTSATSQGGLNLVLGWNKDQQRLELYQGSSFNSIMAATLAATHLNTNNTAGAWLNLAIVASDAGNVPITTGYFGFNEIKSIFNSTISGLANNNLIGA